MDLSKVMSISGKGGLFKIVSQSRGSIIVESLVDGKKMPVFATHRSSVLEDISMFTNEEDVPLKKVFRAIYQKEEGKKVSIDLKNDNSPVREYFESVLPDFDKERVYNSDIKKVLSWYNILIDHNLISEQDEETEETSETLEETQEKPANDESTADDKKAGGKKGKKE
jgi:stringent starvation protein B